MTPHARELSDSTICIINSSGGEKSGEGHRFVHCAQTTSGDDGSPRSIIDVVDVVFRAIAIKICIGVKYRSASNQMISSQTTPKLC